MHFIYRTLFVAVVVQFSLQNVTKIEKQNRIYKGKIAEPHSAPYMVAILMMRNGIQSMCGGSLIKPKFVLTAAHCLNRSMPTKVVIGVQSLDQIKPKNVVNTLKFNIHRRFNTKRRKYDIAIIELVKPVQLSNKIALIQLPTVSDIYFLPGKYGRLTGFGRISDQDEDVHDNLKELRVRIISNDNCRKFNFLDSTHICGYGENNGSACLGDSGSPLVLENTNIQIGIDSVFATEGCTKGFPHVYTNVVSYLDWIKKWSR